MDATITCHPYSLELRRNIIPNPARGTSADSWYDSTNTVPGSLTGTGDGCTWTTVAAGDSFIRTDYIPVDPVFSLAVDLATVAAVARTGYVRLVYDTGASVDSAPLAIGQAWGTLTWNNIARPAGALSVRVYLRVAGATVAGETFKWRHAIGEELAAVGAWFDGDTPDADPVEYTWIAQRNGSPSTIRQQTSSDLIGLRVNGPWAAEFESLNQVHRYMDQPSAVEVTVRPGGGRAGEMVAQFASHQTAYKAFRALGYPHLWFAIEYTDPPAWLESIATVDQFIISPDDRVRLEQQEPYDVGVWHITIPWTEAPL